MKTTIETNALPASVLTSNQKKSFGPKFYTEHGSQLRIVAEVRHDDRCGNGHNSFAITATIDEKCGGQWRDHSGGCCHDEVAKHFPELAPLIKWHLTSTDGPMHYVANTTYHASDKDHRGLRKDERRQLKNGRTGLNVWEVVTRNDKGERISVSSSNWIDSAQKPAGKLSAEYEPVWIEGEGKKSDLEAARSCAVWPDATLDQLQDKDALLARLPALMAEFKAAVESLGFVY
jgi:hypothetical protein